MAEGRLARVGHVDVVLVLGQVARGGTEIQMLNLAHDLEKRGLAVLLVVVEAVRDFTVEGLDTYSLGVDRRGVLGLLELVRAAAELRRLIGRTGPRVVHSALARGYVVTALAASRKSGTRYVTWRRNRGVHLAGLGVAGRTIERFSARRHDVVVANSPTVADYWRNLLGPKAAIVVIPNSLPQRFFDLPETETGDGPASSDPARVVSVGALKPVKNHALIIDALRSVHRRHGIRMDLVLVGDGALRQDLVSQARNAAVPLTITGVVDDVVPELEDATVYVHAAHSEGLSNAVLEALAVGCAVVAPDIAGMRELVGDAAELYEPGSVEGLAATIAKVVADPALRLSLRLNARARVAEHQPQRIVDQYLELYGVIDPCAA